MTIELDREPRFVPKDVMMTDGKRHRVTGVVIHPAGHKPPGSPIRTDANLKTLEVKTKVGSRWYGIADGRIGSYLEMEIIGFPANFEEMAAWEKVADRRDPAEYTSGEMTPVQAWLYAASWGGGRNGMCLYGFYEDCLPQSEQHRQDCITHLEDDCLPYARLSAVAEVPKLEALIAYLRKAPLKTAPDADESVHLVVN